MTEISRRTVARSVAWSVPAVALATAAPAFASSGTPSVTNVSGTFKNNQSVTLTGTNLQNVKSISYNGSPAIIQSKSATSIIFGVPKNAYTGHVVLTTNDGTTIDIGTYDWGTTYY